MHFFIQLIPFYCPHLIYFTIEKHCCRKKNKTCNLVCTVHHYRRDINQLGYRIFRSIFNMHIQFQFPVMPRFFCSPYPVFRSMADDMHASLIWNQAILVFIQAHRTCIHNIAPQCFFKYWLTKWSTIWLFLMS